MKDYNYKLLEEILCNKDPIIFFKNNVYKFQTPDLKKHLHYLLKEKNVTKSHIIKKSTINITYAYHIFAGHKNPSREKLFALSFAFKLNLEETQKLLRHASVMELSVFSLRDAVIIYALVNKYTLMDLNDLLYDLGEEPIE